MKKVSSVSAFFPCFNEERNVKILVSQLQAVLPQVARQYEIIIVNDGSTDGTLKRAQQLAKQFPEIKVISHDTNLGYGAALRSGFNNAQYEWIFFTDGDNQFDVSQLLEFVPHTLRYEAVIGYRQHRAEGWRRALNTWLFKQYIKTVFSLKVIDIDCAFKLIKAERLKSLPLSSTGALISTEFLYLLQRANVKFKEIPVKHLPRRYGQPTGSNLTVIIKAFWESWKLYYRLKTATK